MANSTGTLDDLRVAVQDAIKQHISAREKAEAIIQRTSNTIKQVETWCASKKLDEECKKAGVDPKGFLAISQILKDDFENAKREEAKRDRKYELRSMSFQLGTLAGFSSRIEKDGDNEKVITELTSWFKTEKIIAGSVVKRLIDLIRQITGTEQGKPNAGVDFLRRFCIKVVGKNEWWGHPDDAIRMTVHQINVYSITIQNPLDKLLLEILRTDWIWEHDGLPMELATPSSYRWQRLEITWEYMSEMLAKLDFVGSEGSEELEGSEESEGSEELEELEGSEEINH